MTDHLNAVEKTPAQRGRVGRAENQPDVRFAGPGWGERDGPLAAATPLRPLRLRLRSALPLARLAAMPVQWTISHSKRLVLWRWRAPVGAQEIEGYLHAMALE